MTTKDNLRLYECEFRNLENECVIKNAILYESQKDIKRFYYFGHRIIPLISQNIVNEYDLTAFSWTPDYLSYSLLNVKTYQTDFKNACELLIAIQRIRGGLKLGHPCKYFDFCIELLELVIINWNE